MRIGVAATPEVAIPTLNWLLKSNHELALVITQPDRPAGRGQILKQSVVGDWAESNHIKLVKPENSRQLVGVIEDLDVVLTIGYGVLLPQNILNLPNHGFLNLHFSLLPAYRGAAPVQRALENGENTSGVTVFQLDKGMDTGPVYTQISVEIDPTWRSLEMLKHLSEVGVKAIDDALKMIENCQSPSVQSGDSSIAPKISKEQARIDFEEPASTVINKVRAFMPEPGAWTMWKEQPFKISRALKGVQLDVRPGEIVQHEKSVYVGCANGESIELLDVIPAGKKEMKATDWARGAHLNSGDHLG